MPNARSHCVQRLSTLRLRHNDPGRRVDLYQFKVEDQVLASQLMIGIQYYDIRFYFYNNHGYLLSGTIVHRQLHAHFRLHIRGESVGRKFDYRLGVSRSIGIFYRYLDGLFLSNGHAEDTVIKSLDHHTTAHFKLQRRAPFRGIERRSIRKTAVIMDFYGISNFYFLCHVY